LFYDKMLLMIPQIAIIIPTYNAKNSITRAISGIFKKAKNAIIIVVDDNSPDGTAQLIKKSFPFSRKITLIVRKNKGGRGSAVLDGFKQGLKNKSVQFFIEMDSDLCHDPRYIPLLVKKCAKFDVAIASKYLKKSRIKGLSYKRKIFSRIANFYLRQTLKIPITDYTNGYRCYRRIVLEKINLRTIRSKGFITLSEIAYRIYRKGFSFGEISFNFKHYNAEKSNFNIKEVIEALLTTFRLILQR